MHWLLDIRVDTRADCGAEPDVKQAAPEEDEAAAEAAVFEELEALGAEEPDPDKFTDSWDVSYNTMDDYWYY